MDGVMFCPKCAVQNNDETRFCRSCGTDLEIVAAALNTRSVLPAEFSSGGESRIELTKQRQQLPVDGIGRVIRGAIVFVTGILLGIPLYFFSEGADWHSNWILIWLIFCGWIPFCGAIMLGGGLSSLIHSRMTQREIDRTFGPVLSSSTKESGQTRRIDSFTEERHNPPGVTERTTASMNNPLADGGGSVAPRNQE